MRKNQGGFTLVEMLVVVPITLIVCIFMVSLLISKNGELHERNARLGLRIEGLTVLEKLQDELSFASKYNDNIRAPLVDPNAPSGGWRYNSTPPTLIIDLPAVDKPRTDPSRQFVYYVSGPYNGQIAVNNVIYYVSGTKLLRRFVIPNPSSVSPPNYYKKTCPPGDTTSGCQDDLQLTARLSSMDIQYYDINNIAVNNNPTAADKIKVTLNMRDTVNGNQIDESVSITIKKYNDF